MPLKQLTQSAEKPAVFKRVEPECKEGLNVDQVRQRLEAGAFNKPMEGLTASIPKIVLKNALTLFNLINIFLAVIIIWVGHIENTLFMGIVICNTGMGIFQEIRAKRTLDKLSVLAQPKVTVVRDGKTRTIGQGDIVLDDIMYLKSGDQVCADAIVRRSNGLEADESLLTGETDKIQKKPGDTVLSGSYVTGGQAYVQVTAVGEDNYANALTAEVKKGKKNKSKLLNTLNTIIRILTVIIIPLGTLLFYFTYSGGATIEDSVLGTSAAMIGMIPSGLVLLTGVTLMVGAMTLARKRALVQSLPSIETLARADVLCLDKTGTITDGTLTFERMELIDGHASESRMEQVISELMGALQDSNTTAKALRKTFGESMKWYAKIAVPFSSDRKWSGATYDSIGSYILGAPNMVFPQGGDFVTQADQYATQGYRVLCLAYSEQPIIGEQLPDDTACIALLILSDTIRRDAAATFRYFAQEGVTLKVISGDNFRTVSAIAEKAGLENADKAIDMSRVKDADDYAEIVEKYTVFGSVTPQQKKNLILALQQNGHTTCMTGDGVNDILAMREADCSIAMVSGSDAARSACDFVLMSSNFSAMVSVLKEGRRVINNIDRVASLYLVNTVYSVLLSLIYTLLPFSYPFAPVQMTPINALTVGIPSFFLALQANYTRPEGKLLTNILGHSFPAALTIVFNTLYIQLAGVMFDLPQEQMSTMVVFLVGIVGFYLIFRIARPYTKWTIVLISGLGTAFVLVFLFFGRFFSLASLLNRNVFFYLPLVYFSFYFHSFLGKQSEKLIKAFKKQRRRMRLARRRGEVL